MERRAADDVFNEAIALTPEEWPDFLHRACEGNETLRAEVESLLQVYQRHPPPPLTETEEISPERIGRYPILGQLGRGGMGRVYLAEDPTLGRRVALKMLPARVIIGADQAARFRREARMLASLGHPHIATLYSLEEADGTPFLTMELVAGDSLASRIAASASGVPLDLPEVLRLGIQIAKGLQAAHERGIVHRDLKPANVALTAQGEVKILDFGLAKFVGAEAVGEPETGAPDSFIGSAGWQGDTIPGGILGSPGYMSPEQIRGVAAGPASDLWAFGCVIFECLAGWPAFPGVSSHDRVAATLHAEPDWTALPDRVPERWRRLLRACLVKDPAHRISSAERLREELEGIAARLATPSNRFVGWPGRDLAARLAGRGARHRTARLMATAVLALALIAGLIATVMRSQSPRRPPPAKEAPSLRRLTFSEGVVDMALAPDDQSVACVTRFGALVILDLATGARRVIRQDERFVGPCWSPDGKDILVSVPREGQNWVMYLVHPDEGTATQIGPGNCRGVGWSPDGLSVIARTLDISARHHRLFLVHRSSGDTTSVPIDASIRRVDEITYPPSGGPVVLWGVGADNRPGGWITSRLGGPVHRLYLDDLASSIQWSRSGNDLLYLTLQGTAWLLKRVPMDPRTGRPTGPSRTLDQRAEIAQFESYHHGDRMLYLLTSKASVLWVLDRGPEGAWTQRRVLAGSFGLLQPRLSPDGGRIAVGQDVAGRSGNIIILSVTDGSYRQYPLSSPMRGWTAWSPDGTKVVHLAGAGAESRLCKLDLVSGDATVLSARAGYGYVYWSPDERIRYQREDEADQSYTFFDPATRVEEPALRGPSRGTAFQSAVSPDGEWMAVAGNRNDLAGVAVWLVHLTDQSERVLFAQPAAPIGWSRDGAWVYAVHTLGGGASLDTERSRVVRISVRDGTVEFLTELPEGELVFWSNADISPDGNRIVVTIAESDADLYLAEGPELAR